MRQRGWRFKKTQAARGRVPGSATPATTDGSSTALQSLLDELEPSAASAAGYIPILRAWSFGFFRVFGVFRGPKISCVLVCFVGNTSSVYRIKRRDI